MDKLCQNKIQLRFPFVRIIAWAFGFKLFQKIYSRKYFLLQYRIRPYLDPNAVFDIGLTCEKKMYLKKETVIVRCYFAHSILSRKTT